MDEKKRHELNLRTMYFPYRDKYDGDKIKLVGLADENETPTGENILIVALTVAILACCGILFVLAWAASQPIY